MKEPFDSPEWNRGPRSGHSIREEELKANLHILDRRLEPDVDHAKAYKPVDEFFLEELDQFREDLEVRIPTDPDASAG